MTTLDRCICLAVEAHSGQIYHHPTGDQPYILHCLRVMLRVDTDKLRQVAVLHDVLEDTDAPLSRINIDTGIDPDVSDAIVILYRNNHSSYSAYIWSIALSRHPLAIPVKIADLKENLSCNSTDEQRARYEKALTILESVDL